jgi:hypothetical protein
MALVAVSSSSTHDVITSVATSFCCTHAPQFILGSLLNTQFCSGVRLSSYLWLILYGHYNLDITRSRKTLGYLAGFVWGHRATDSLFGLSQLRLDKEILAVIEETKDGVVCGGRVDRQIPEVRGGQCADDWSRGICS